MRQSTMRWIAIAIVVAMIGTVGIGLVSGGGDPAASGADDDGRAPTATDGTQAPLADGPHVVLDLCAGVACPEPDEAAQQALVAQVDDDPRVADSLLVSSDQAYQLFLDEWGDRQDLVEEVDPADVPARIELDLYDPDVATDVVASYRDHESVANVRQVDPATS